MSEAVSSSQEETPTPTVSEEPKHEEVATQQSPKETENGLGGVAEFRKTLTNLSRQLKSIAWHFCINPLRIVVRNYPPSSKLLGIYMVRVQCHRMGIVIILASARRPVWKAGSPVFLSDQTAEPRNLISKTFLQIRSFE